MAYYTCVVVKQFVRIGGLKAYGGHSMSCMQENEWFKRVWRKQRELYAEAYEWFKLVWRTA